MRKSDTIHLLLYSLKIFLFKRSTPLFATFILTDQCNLSCLHCRLNNYHRKGNQYYSFEQIYKDMKKLYKKGVRILCFSGGEIALWEKENPLHTIAELVTLGKNIGFLYIALATNGTIPIDYGNADFVLISVDGTKETHDSIRGNTYERILANIRKSSCNKIAVFMAINKKNQTEIHSLCQLAMDEKNIQAVSFNFHTPFHGTEELALTSEETEICCREIETHLKKGYPILNLRSCFPYLLNNNFPKPCKQLMVMDMGEEILCNRCIKEKNLCKQCGYLETVEVAMLFQGKLPILFDALKTYWKYL